MADSFDDFPDAPPRAGRTTASASGDEFSDFPDAPSAINFDRPDADVRADIAKLSGDARKQALDQWAETFVSKERAQGGLGQAVSDVGRTLARGTFAGPFLDEANAATQKVLQTVTGGLAGSDYDEALAYQRAQDRAVDKAAPVLSTVGKLAGGVAGAVAALPVEGASLAAQGAGMVVGGPLAAVAPAASLPGQMAQGAGIGASYGAAAGFGNAEGDERVGDAARGAVLGGAVGGVLPPVIAAGSAAGAAVSDAVSPTLARWSQQLTNVLEEAGIRTTRPPTSAGAMAAPPIAPATPAQAAADQVIANQLSRSGRNVADLRQVLAQSDEARTFGPGSQAQNVLAPVDLDPQLQRLASSAARQQPEAGNVAASFITARQKGETPPVPLHAEAGLPVKPKMAPVDPDAPPMGQYERIKDAMRRAFQINTASTHGFGNTAARVEERLIEAAKTEAKKLYSDAYQAGQGIDLAPVVKPVLDKWRAAAVDETEDVAKLFEKFATWTERAVAPGGVKHHIERFDKTKQVMDDEIDKAFRAGDRYLGGLMTQFKNDLLDVVDGLKTNGVGEAYAKARDAYSSRMEMREALDLGRKLFSENADVAVDQFRGLSSGQAKMARIGIVDSFERRMAGKRRAADITQEFETPRVQEIIEAMIPRARSTKSNPNPEFGNRPERFGQYLANEQRMIGTRDEVLGNSKTAQRLSDDKSMNSMVDMLDDIKKAGTSPVGATMQFLANQLDKLFGFRADTAVEIARKLFTADPGARDRLLTAVEARLGPDRAAQFRQLMADHHSRIMQVGANTTSASVQTPSGPGTDPYRQNPPGRLPPDPKPMTPPSKLGGPVPVDDGSPADLASIAIDASRRSDAVRRRDTVSQIEPDAPQHHSTRQPRADGGRFAPGKPAALSQGPEPRYSNELADIALRAGMPGMSGRLNDRTSGAGMIADAVGSAVVEPARALTRAITNPTPYLEQSEDEKRQTIADATSATGLVATGAAVGPRPQGAGVGAFIGPKGKSLLTPEQQAMAREFTTPAGHALHEIEAAVKPASGKWESVPQEIGMATSRGEPLTIGQVIDAPEMFAAYPELATIQIKAEPAGRDAVGAIHMRRGTFKKPSELQVDVQRLANLDPTAREAEFRKALQSGAFDIENMPGLGRLNSWSQLPNYLAMGTEAELMGRLSGALKAGKSRDEILAAFNGHLPDDQMMAVRHALTKLSDDEIDRRAATAASASRPYNGKEGNIWIKNNKGQPRPDYFNPPGVGHMVKDEIYNDIRRDRADFSARHITRRLIDESVKRDMGQAPRQERPLEKLSPLDLYIAARR